MTILVTGGNGQLGSALRLASSGSSHCYLFTDVAELDITSAETIEAFFSKESVDIVVNCAAYTAVDDAESDEAKADLINHKAVALLAEACKRHNATLIHISTDYIFSGEADAPYTEECNPAPLNAYGRTKLEGERAIAESECNAIILRTSWLYSEFGRNFCKTMRELTATRTEIKVVADQFGTPTYAGDLAEAIVEIIESGQYSKFGIYNYSNEGECSWYDFACEIARQSGNIGCKICPCTTADYPTKAVRPRYSVLDKSKFVSTFGIEISQWQEALAECIKKF
ncbi:MAG: dTDP-4-dehydrorhamnose reductase [Alistipes sp.]|nr:dTDP-4-dehydrorhamnose reductase [Alistipes sp.]